MLDCFTFLLLIVTVGILKFIILVLDFFSWLKVLIIFIVIFNLLDLLELLVQIILVLLCVFWEDGGSRCRIHFLCVYWVLNVINFRGVLILIAAVIVLLVIFLKTVCLIIHHHRALTLVESIITFLMKILLLDPMITLLIIGQRSNSHIPNSRRCGWNGANNRLICFTQWHHLFNQHLMWNLLIIILILVIYFVAILAFIILLVQIWGARLDITVIYVFNAFEIYISLFAVNL